MLDEALEHARAGRVAPSHGLRLALGYLYDVGDRHAEWFDREPYDDFWRVASQEDANLSEGSNAAGYGRSITLTSYMNGIAGRRPADRGQRRRRAVAGAGQACGYRGGIIAD